MFLIGKLKDRDSVVNLKAKRMDQVIDNDYVLELSIFDDPEIFDVVSVVGLHAVASVQKSADQFLGLVEVVYDDWGVFLCASCEYINVVEFGHFLEELKTVRADIEVEWHSLMLELDFAVVELGAACKLCVDQGFVQVHEEDLLVTRFFGLWKTNLLFLQESLRWTFQTLNPIV